MLTLFICTQTMSAQSYKKEVLKYQKQLNKDYKNPDESPLSDEDRKKFKRFNFYPVSESYKVKAKFERISEAEPFKMPTSGHKTPVYEVYGIASFSLDGKEYTLNIYIRVID